MRAGLPRSRSSPPIGNVADSTSPSARASRRCWSSREEFGGFAKSFDREGFTDELTSALKLRDIDLVAMAGFGTIVTAPFHEAYPGRVLNTHPSLLPAFKGWHAVAQALESGASETGCTVHIATEALDDGPILAQRRGADRARRHRGDTARTDQVGRARVVPAGGR